MHLDPLGEPRLVADQPPQLRAAARSPAVGERGRAGPARRDWCARGARRGGARRWSCPCRPSRRRAPGRCSRARPTARCSGCRKTVHFSHGNSSARSSSSTFVMTRKRRCASGCSNGSASAGSGCGDARRPAGRQLQQRLGRLAGRWSASVEQRVLVRLAHVVEPLRRARRSRAARPRQRRRTAAASAAPALALRRTPGRRSPSPSRGSRRAAPRPSSDASPACAARPSAYASSWWST